MKQKTKLNLIKILHTIIYLIMVMAIFYIIYAGITKTYDKFLYISLGLLTIEVTALLINKMECPLTILAKKYGDPKGYVGDTFLPEKFTQKYTFKFFGTLLSIGLLILILDFLKLI